MSASQVKESRVTIHNVSAQIGQWYEQAGNSELFHVVGLDERSNTIEMRWILSDQSGHGVASDRFTSG